MQNPVAMSHTFDASDDLFAPRMKRLALRAIAVNQRRQTLAASTLQQYGSRFRGSLWEILNPKPQSSEGVSLPSRLFPMSLPHISLIGY
ncbi:hypothetical protein [Pseudanabaena sp. FACHB-2040]|uniref:hypothetical protein n=1 Tax=Pseudanabaena sp. FACHB-2040 TaxID=2692859 RepID=UPI0016848DA4|nr:hypothetical protein [Pseudanabaena sp. FACHB-2040]MBD2261021.1 hypothetical protein [Pseudanabaena sp. FACHB-2040]